MQALKCQGAGLPWWLRWTQTSHKETTEAQRSLLEACVASTGPTLFATNVPVGSGQQEFMHTVHNTPLAPTAPACSYTVVGNNACSAAAMSGPPVVLMPGYGAGVGFFMRILGPLASAVRLYAVDWLGTGLSGRPKFDAKSREQAESFFIDSLLSWRIKAGLDQDKMVLVGHSLGGYLAACYALRHPEHVKHLVLVCPAGVPKTPDDWQNRFLGGRSTISSSIFRTAMWAWKAGVTPHSIIRALGPFGPRLCEKYVINRFAHHGDGLQAQEIQYFKTYFYGIIAQPGSGEHALRHLLAPGAFAYVPLVDRLKELQVPVTFIYGEADWMRPQHAVDLCQELKKERKPKVASDLHVEIIRDAGHFPFIDQPEEFNAAFLDAIKGYLNSMPPGHMVGHTADSTTWGHSENGTTTVPI